MAFMRVILCVSYSQGFVKRSAVRVFMRGKLYRGGGCSYHHVEP
jgi:hypothetical protein